MNNVIDQINNLHDDIITSVTRSIISEGELQSYEIVWKQLQDIAAKEIGKILRRKFPNSVITIPKTKSTYPDIKLTINNSNYAIDIKCHEIQLNPWYDMARLDTYIESRYNKFEEEWELLIQYDSETKQFIKAYFGLFRDFVGYDARCDGLKYRPYDGKIRPKTWYEIENNITYWDTEERFLEGLRNSQINRWKTNIESHLIPLLTDDEMQEFKSLF